MAKAKDDEMITIRREDYDKLNHAVHRFADREDKWREFYFRLDTAIFGVTEARRAQAEAEQRLTTAFSLAPHVEGPAPL